jgi:hypothetical protein
MSEPPPQAGKGPWSKDEDERLLRAVATYKGKKWKAVAALVQTRTHIQCSQRWIKALNPDLGKGRWNQDEDQLLFKLVGEHGTNWAKVAEDWKQAPRSRSHTQIRDRWVKIFDPNLRREPWTEQEDKLILLLHPELGNSWARIAQRLPGRVGESVKYRYQTLMRGNEAEERNPGCKRVPRAKKQKRMVQEHKSSTSHQGLCGEMPRQPMAVGLHLLEKASHCLGRAEEVRRR